MCQDLYTLDICARKRYSPRRDLTFITAKGQAFLTVPSFHQRSLSPCASRRANSSTGLWTSETFYESHSPFLLVTLSLPFAHPHAPFFFSLSSVLRCFSPSRVSFLSISQPRSLTSNWRHRQSHLDYSEDQPGLTSLPVKEETAIPGDPRTPSTPNFTPRAACLGFREGLLTACGPPFLFTQPLPTAQRSATTPIKGRSAGLLLPVGRLT